MRDETVSETSSNKRSEGVVDSSSVVEVAPDRPIESPAQTIESGPLYKYSEELEADFDISNLAREESAEVEDFEELPELPVDRRDFMKLFTAVSSTAVATSCMRRPEEKLVPYVEMPKDQIIGKSKYYRSSCGECASGCGIEVRTTDGRAAKIEGYAEDKVNQGGSCAQGQASLQKLYHPNRKRSPLINRGQRVDSSTWGEVYDLLSGKITSANGKVAILTKADTGTSSQFYKEYLQNIGSSADNFYTFDSNYYRASVIKAYEIAYGKQLMPRVELKGAKTIVGVGTDFLNNGLASVHMAKQFSRFRKANQVDTNDNFINFESNMSVTGTQADKRVVIHSGSEIWVALGILRELSRLTGDQNSNVVSAIASAGDIDGRLKEYEVDSAAVVSAAEKLQEGSAVFLAGSEASSDANGTALQLVAILINQLAGSFGSHLHINKEWMVAPSNPDDLERLRNNISNIDVLMIVDCNPDFELPKNYGFSEMISNVQTVVSAQVMPCETDELASMVLPISHFLESWGDAQPFAGYWNIRQPVVRPVVDVRQFEDILLWAAAAAAANNNGSSGTMPYKDYYTYMKANWANKLQASGSGQDSSRTWHQILKKGHYDSPKSQSLSAASFGNSVKIKEKSKSPMSLLMPLDQRLGTGRGADLPVLQEVGDAYTSIAWDSWAAVHPETAKEMGLTRFNQIEVSSDTGSIKIGLFPMPGIDRNTIVIPRGNGRRAKKSEVSYGVGVDPLLIASKERDFYTNYPTASLVPVEIKKTGVRRVQIPHMQKLTSELGNRTDIVKKVTPKDVKKYQSKPPRSIDKLIEEVDLYPKLPVGDYRWGLSIDLDSCIGCSTCMVACAVENNVPQLGRKQVLLGREMHWIRLDRYFEGPVDNPQVSFQPMMCQQCNHAPCEAVCPVFATTHDDEGINAQTYNRCVGTRYCANACPYKARRFNWFTMKWNTPSNPRPTNPDVTVRTKGVMEKCTFCYQRVKDAKFKALDSKAKKILDGDVKTACQQACPTDAISFGDLLDPESKITQDRNDHRAYLALGGDPEHKHFGIKTWPNVSYKAQVVKHKLNDNHHGSDQVDDSGHSKPH